jgi:hypothetical protein
MVAATPTKELTPGHTKAANFIKAATASFLRQFFANQSNPCFFHCFAEMFRSDVSQHLRSTTTDNSIGNNSIVDYRFIDYSFGDY